MPPPGHSFLASAAPTPQVSPRSADVPGCLHASTLSSNALFQNPETHHASHEARRVSPADYMLTHAARSLLDFAVRWRETLRKRGLSLVLIPEIPIFKVKYRSRNIHIVQCIWSSFQRYQYLCSFVSLSSNYTYVNNRSQLICSNLSHKLSFDYSVSVRIVCSFQCNKLFFLDLP